MTAAKKARRWSQHVTETSDAMDLPSRLFSRNSPRQIAMGIKNSAEKSHRRKSSPFRSAMSMLTFYLNRAGRKLPRRQRERLQRAKKELRLLFNK